MSTQIGRDEVHIWRGSTRISADFARRLGELLSDAERAKAARFTHQADRNRYIASHAMLRLVLSAYVGAPAFKLDFQTDRYGKPRLQQATRQGLSFSLSHSGELALLALALRQPVGIDIEAIRCDFELSTLVDRVLAETECELLKQTPLNIQRALFFRAWVRKEAVLKASGRGLTCDPRRITVLRSKSLNGPQSTKVDTGPNGEQWNVRDVTSCSGYAAAVAATARNWELRAFEHQWEMFRNLLN